LLIITITINNNNNNRHISIPLSIGLTSEVVEIIMTKETQKDEKMISGLVKPN